MTSSFSSLASHHWQNLKYNHKISQSSENSKKKKKKKSKIVMMFFMSFRIFINLPKSNTFSILVWTVSTQLGK